MGDEVGGDIFDDLVAEQDRLETILAGVATVDWHSPSAAEGWTIRDVVVHLAQTEEAVVVTATGGARPPGWASDGETLDQAMGRLVRADDAAPDVVFERWRTARRAAVQALRAADPHGHLPWAAAPLKPRTLATTRLAEHWAHGLDITGPLGIAFPDTLRLRHIAWLGHSSLPYAFAFAGQRQHGVFCELNAPDDTLWQFGPPDADSTISGSAGAFCRVGARRLKADRSGLVASGPHGAAALEVLRNYAG
jgi:uncharacterized protein (TIGR03084 family)